MQAKQQVPAHSKILPAQIVRVDGLRKHWYKFSAQFSLGTSLLPDELTVMTTEISFGELKVKF